MVYHATATANGVAYATYIRAPNSGKANYLARCWANKCRARLATLVAMPYHAESQRQMPWW